jgi:hypothetical protein
MLSLYLTLPVALGPEVYPDFNRNEYQTKLKVKNGVFRMLRHGSLVRIDVSKELSASIFRVTRIGELGT